jgi:hypothetical protein
MYLEFQFFLKLRYNEILTYTGENILKKISLLFIWVIFTSIHGFANEDTIKTLTELKKSQELLNDEIKATVTLIKDSTDSEEKERLESELKDLKIQSQDFKIKFEKIATGIDTTVITTKKEYQSSTLSEDFQLLIKPLLHAAKQSTEDMRKKAKLQEEKEYYENTLFYANKAHQNIEKLLQDGNSTLLDSDLKKLEKQWLQKISLITSNLNATQQHMTMLEKDDVPFTQSFQDNFKNFFQQQGLVLLQGIGAFFIVIVLMQTIHMLLVKIFPMLVNPKRPFSIRFLDLIYWVLTVVLAISAPMLIFYYQENWILSSIAILILFGVMWTFRNLIPKLWKQGRLFLNIGPVRQEERIYYQNLPWRVKNINVFTILENPDSGVKLRLPIEELVGLTSRPSLPNEPWFPCRKNDWVLLSNDYYGKVVGISFEFIELVDHAGGRKTFIVSDFLALSPLNLSTGFMILDTIGISYSHQKESTREIITMLESFIVKQAEAEGYHEGLESVSVQFAHAGNSSLDLKIIAYFNGKMASNYFRMRRAISRWSVDACTEYGWEIPFPQLTISKHESFN